MRVGSLVKVKDFKRNGLGVIIDIHKRDLSCYKSHTYFLVHYCTVSRQQWCHDYEMELICE